VMTEGNAESGDRNTVHGHGGHEIVMQSAASEVVEMQNT
jgi:hypothetical protein